MTDNLNKGFLDLPVAHGSMKAYQAYPEGKSDLTAIVVITEVFGLSNHVRHICDQLAGEGYYAIAPDIYHRFGELITFSYDDYQKTLSLLNKLDNDMLMEDVRVCQKHLLSTSNVAAHKIGTLGFCYGGLGAYIAATQQIGAFSVVFYGGGITEEREGFAAKPPLKDSNKIKVPMSLYFGQEDSAIPMAQVELIKKTLTECKVDFELNAYEHSGHAFMNADRPSMHNPEVAALAWQHLMAWLERKGFSSSQAKKKVERTMSEALA